ncbi:MAG: starch-binding protein [Muribaculaceae bacterium]|nr:starch-binding protein [Muribaculaceae bacterium]
MKNSFYSTLRLLVIALCIGSVAQVHAITIKVQKGGTAPYLYAYLGSGDNATKLTGDWPGTQFTNKDDNGFWTMDIPNQTTVNLIFNMGDGEPQTGNINDVVGVNGTATFIYDGNNKAIAPMPQGTYQSGKVAYFACPTTWDTSNLKSQIKHNDYYEEHSVSFVGTDGAGHNVYADLSFTNWGDTPQQIHFYDNAGKDTPMFDYVLGGYYNTGGLATQIVNLSSDNGFSDENFRAGITSQYGVNEGATFAPSTITRLDVSNKGITSLAGIEKFTSLIELNASKNALTTADLGSNSNLEILNLSYNSALRGFSSNYSTNSNYINLAANNSNLKELYLSNCSIGYFQAINNHYGVSSLERLDLSNNTNMGGWSTGIAAQTGLKYLNVTNNAYGSDALKLTNLTELDTLIADNNPNLGNISTLSSASNLRYLSLQNCGLTNDISFRYNLALEYIDISNNSATPKNFHLSYSPALKVFKAHNAAIKQNGLVWQEERPNLDTLIVSGNPNMHYLSSLNYATNLRYLDMSDGDLLLGSMPTFTGSNFPRLNYIDFSNNLIYLEKTLSDFAVLKTLKMGGNYIADNDTGINRITLSNCPAIETIDISGNTKMSEIGLVNQGYNNSNFTLPTITATGCDALHILNLSDNAFTSVPELPNVPSTIQSLKLNNNNLASLTMPEGSPIQFLYAENNSSFTGNYELTATAAGQLKGLDLGNNRFTSFKAEGTALSALMIGNNTSLTTLELHGNNNLTCTTAETTMSEGSGLYLLGNTALATINIENSKFNNIGANKSLEGLTAVTTLRAAHNEFETFTNSNYDAPNHDARDHTLATIVGKPSLEDLTGLVYLDLSNNLLKDSVHLYRNTALKHLDVSHNQILGDLPTNENDRMEMIKKKVSCSIKYGLTINGGAGNNGTVGISVEWDPNFLNLVKKHDPYRNEDRYADFRPCDLRDTTGLYHLDLHYNTQLEYIDISYTNIHNTAMGREYMNPGWDRSNNWNDDIRSGSPNPEYGPVKHHFIWMQPAGAHLKVFKADHNNMQSLGTAHNGIPYYENLDTLSATHMYGDCLFMTDKTIDDYIGYGTKGFNGTNCANARYIDLSYGYFYSIDPQHLANVEKLIVTGNPLGGGHYPNYVLDVTNNSKLQQLQADLCTDLQTIEAHDLNSLAILDVSGDTNLKTLRAYNDPVLYNANTDFITGLSECSNLEELWVSNDNLPELEVWNNKNLTTLKCYDNAILPSLNLSENTLLSYLDFHNCMLNSIDLSKNTALTYIDCSSPSVATSTGETGKNKLSDLEVNSNVIATVIANCNDLHSIKGVNKASLTRLEFEHNHINGIDLSNTGLTATTLKDADNGRTIEGDYSIITIKNGSTTTKYDLFFFQLDNTVTGGGTFIGDKASMDVLKGLPRDALSIEGMQANKITAWTANAVPLTGGSKSPNNYVDPHNLNGIVDPDEVIGSIVVLDEHNKHTEYTYNTGVSEHTSTYYLDWSAPGVVTAVTDIEVDNKPSVTGGIGAITIQAPDGTIVGIFDMAGRLVQQITANGGEMVIDGMAPGVYIVNGQKVIVK